MELAFSAAFYFGPITLLAASSKFINSRPTTRTNPLHYSAAAIQSLLTSAIALLSFLSYSPSQHNNVQAEIPIELYPIAASFVFAITIFMRRYKLKKTGRKLSFIFTTSLIAILYGLLLKDYMHYSWSPEYSRSFLLCLVAAYLFCQQTLGSKALEATKSTSHFLISSFLICLTSAIYISSTTRLGHLVLTVNIMIIGSSFLWAKEKAYSWSSVYIGKQVIFWQIPFILIACLHESLSITSACLFAVSLIICCGSIRFTNFGKKKKKPKQTLAASIAFILAVSGLLVAIIET